MKSQPERVSLLQAPAVQALIILCLALLAALLVGWVLQHFFGVPLVLVALLHGAMASGMACLCGMAWWWVVMLLCFPVTAVAVHALQLPPAWFLFVFVLLLLLFWSTFRSQVPFYPSGRRVWDAVVKLLPVDRPFRLIDIGSGLGGAVLYLSRMRQDGHCVGIELAPLLWLVSHVRACLSRSRAGFIRGDYRCLDFADYDVIFAYLSPAAMGALWQKARAEMRAGTLLLSYEFMIEGVSADVAVQPMADGPVLYGWYM